MGCLLWFKALMYILHQSLKRCIQYDVTLVRVIAVLDCIVSRDTSDFWLRAIIRLYTCHVYRSNLNVQRELHYNSRNVSTSLMVYLIGFCT